MNPSSMDAPPFPRRSPRLIGRYVLYDAFARGGMATIHYARLLGDEGFTRTVALKHLYPHLSADASFVAMFLEEARLLSRVRHPNVVAPLDIIGLENELFIAMEYVHGQPLSFLCAAHPGPIPPRLASAILTQVLLGLHAVHEATSETGQPLGIVHRDVSPQNVLVDGDGIARLIDFGIAKASGRAQTLSTARGLLKGKLGYLAPEQLREQRVDRRTDIYMAGIVLWELLTGQRLFEADTPSAMFEALAGAITPPSALVPELPAALNAVVLRALASNKEQRFESAKAMATALAQAAPPAATIELGAWVEPIARTELGKRAERIAELETLALNPTTVVPENVPMTITARIERPSVGANQPERAATTAPIAPLEVTTAPMAPIAIAIPDNAVEAELPSMPTSTEAAEVEPESIPKSPADVPVPRWRKALLYAGIATALALSAMSLDSFRATPAALEPAPPRPRAKPISTQTSVLEAAPPPPPTAEVAPGASDGPVVTLGPAIQRGVPEPALPKAVAPETAPRPIAPRPKASSQGRTKAAAGANSKRSAAPQDCSVPYEVDEQGIKRFKRHCF